MAFVKPPARNMPPGSEPWAQWVEEQMSSVTKQTVAVSQYAERAAGGANSALEGNIQNWDEINRVFEVTENSMQLADGAVVWSTLDPELPEDVPINPNVIWYTHDPETREVLRMWQWGYYDDVDGIYVEDWYQAQLGADSIHDEAITSTKVALGAIDWDQIGPGVTATVEGAVSELETLNDTTLPALNTQIEEAQTALTATDNKVNTLQNTTIPNLQTALSNVEGAAQSADKRSTVSTAEPSATTGFPQNAVWQQVNASGAVIGSWRLSGSSWVQMPLDPVVIPNLSAGIITSGVLNTNRLNASEVAAATGGFLSLSAEQITSGTLDTGRLNATSVAAAVANVIELNASRITAGTLSADRIASNSIVGDKIVANAITARELAVGAITADKAIIANAAIKSAMIAEANILTAHIDDLAVTNAKIADTTITNAKILNLDAGKITTGLLDAARIEANSITAGKLAATAIDGKTITGATIQTSSSANTGIKIDTANGLRAWAGGNLGVQISPSIKNGMAVRNPVGEMVPLSDAAFGTHVAVATSSLTYAVPARENAAWTRHASDTLSLTFTAWGSAAIIDWSQQWGINRGSVGATLFILARLNVNGVDLVAENNGPQGDKQNVYPASSSDDPSMAQTWLRGMSVLPTTPGTSYTVRLRFATLTRIAPTANIVLVNRAIRVQQVP